MTVVIVDVHFSLPIINKIASRTACVSSGGEQAYYNGQASPVEPEPTVSVIGTQMLVAVYTPAALHYIHVCAVYMHSRFCGDRIHIIDILLCNIHCRLPIFFW